MLNLLAYLCFLGGSRDSISKLAQQVLNPLSPPVAGVKPKKNKKYTNLQFTLNDAPKVISSTGPVTYK